MSLENTILIVGSGPTGLVMASRLAALGVPVRIIDRLSEPVTTSRAFTIHARTLELLGQMNLANTFLNQGIKTLSMDYHFPMKEDVPKLDFTDLDGIYPFCLTINQSDTEAILRESVTSQGINIEWNTKLVALETSAEGPIQVSLERNGGAETEEVQVSWLIGCDGHYSTVRQQMNISLDGDEYAGTMRMIDVKVTGFEGSDDAVHYFIAKDHMLLINKLPGGNHRVLISDKTEGQPPEQAQKAFQETLDRHFGGTVQIAEPAWSTNFRTSKRQVSTYRQGNIFLAGDSAHVNSPAGGQGMNVAMQDAFNLSWKLAMVVKGEAKASLLDTYELERGPVANQMLEGTNYIHSIIMAHGQGMQERIERMQGGEWNKRAVSQVAGISYTYRTRPEADEDNEDTPLALAVGDRAPDQVISDEQRIYDLIDADGYTLFLFSGQGEVQATYQTLSALADQSQSPFRAKISPKFILSDAAAAQLEATLSQVVVDDQAIIHQLYETFDTSKVYVLRPDYHIAYIGLIEDRLGLLAHLRETLI